MTASRRDWTIAFAGIGFAALLPFLAPDGFVMHLMTSVAIAAMLAIGLQMLLGVSGQLSIGQAAFFGLGAYGAALMTKEAGLPFLLALPLAGIIGGIASLAMVPITRLRGPYLAVATLGFSIMVYLVLKNEEWATGGSYGLIGVPRPELFGFRLRDPMLWYWFCAAVAALTCGMLLLADIALRPGAARLRQTEGRGARLRCNTLLKSQCFVLRHRLHHRARCSRITHEPERLHFTTRSRS